MASTDKQDNIHGSGPVRSAQAFALALGNRISKNIRLTSDVFSDIRGSVRRINGIHITSLPKLAGLFDMEGKEKALSITINMTPSALDIFGYVGALTTGGYVVEIEGDALIAGDHDLYTQLDENGNRWLRLSNLVDGVSDDVTDKVILNELKQLIEKEGTKEIYKVFKKYYDRYPFSDLPSDESIVLNNNSFTDIITEFSSRIAGPIGDKFKNEVVESYCKLNESILIDYKDLLHRLLFDFDGIVHETDSYNEVVVEKIKVKKLLVLKNKKGHQHFDKFKWAKADIGDKFSKVLFAEDENVKNDKVSISFLRSVYEFNGIKYNRNKKIRYRDQFSVQKERDLINRFAHITESEEFTPSQINHIQHLEDYLLIPKGFDIITDTIKGLVRSIASENQTDDLLVNFKWDGSPGFAAGIDPESGQFFVSLKYALVSKNPVLNFSEEDIDLNYAESPGLIDKMKTLFNSLKDVIKDGVVQGDLLFTEEDKGIISLRGVDHVKFRANTITYAVPLNSRLGKLINKARLGVAIHISYNGSSIKDLKGSPIIDRRRYDIPPDGSLFIENPSFHDIFKRAKISVEDLKKISSNLKELNNHYDASKEFIEVMASDKLSKIANSYYNTKVRLRENLKDPDSMVRDLITYVRLQYDVGADSLKSERGKNNKLIEKDSFLEFLNKHKTLLLAYYECMALITEIKEILLSSMTQFNDVSTLVNVDKEFLAIEPEGFVVFNKKYDVTIKLIDRLNFSYYNFNLLKPWDQHEKDI